MRVHVCVCLSRFSVRKMKESHSLEVARIFKMFKIQCSNTSMTTRTTKKEKKITKIPPKLVLGGNAFGTSLNTDDIRKLADKLLLQSGNSTIEIDSAFGYGQGKSESVLSAFKNNRDICISTKVTAFGDHSLKRESIIQQNQTSLNRLQRDSVDILYIHHPSSLVPIVETLHAINELYRQKKFKRFGICHYSAWEVAEIVYLCDKYGLCKPTVYQGRYNIFRRENESELFPCLCHFGISFYAFSPTARGILAVRHRFEDLERGTISAGKFTSKHKGIHFNDYWKKSFFDGREVLYKHIGSRDKKLLLQIVFSWLLFHSQLDGDRGDAIIIGGSRHEHFADNLSVTQNAKPLDVSTVAVVDRVWAMTKKECIPYHRNHEQLEKIIHSKL